MSDISAWQPIITVSTTIVAAAVVAALGATIFKRYESWHNADLASRALSGLTSNFARHCIYNMVRITQFYNGSQSEFPSDTILKKQKFVLSVVSDATKDRMQLIGTGSIFMLEALFLRLRNFNIEIEFARKNKTADIKKVLDYIILKNMQLAARSHSLANDFDELIEESKNIKYFMRLFYIWQARRTIFNKNDFPPGAQKLDRLFPRPSTSTVDSILKTYLDYEVSQAGEYSSLKETYKRIYDAYPGYQPEWFDAKWTVKQEAEVSVAGLCRKDEMSESSVRIADQTGTTA
ncbi:MAG: hypothetical protein ACREDM_09315 [Methylocella sp.]